MLKKSKIQLPHFQIKNEQKTDYLVELFQLSLYVSFILKLQIYFQHSPILYFSGKTIFLLDPTSLLSTTEALFALKEKENFTVIP